MLLQTLHNMLPIKHCRGTRLQSAFFGACMGRAQQRCRASFKSLCWSCVGQLS